MLAARARLNAVIRRFFDERRVMEVETPLLSLGTVTEPELQAFSVPVDAMGMKASRYLQTSPEFAMKRLLAAGSGSIYQITKAFRSGETGRYHNPEFTLLEWYRVAFDRADLENEVICLLETLSAAFGYGLKIHRINYLDLFQNTLSLHPLECTLTDFEELALARGRVDAARLCGRRRESWLDFLFSELIQSQFEEGTLTLVGNYPAILPSLAKKSGGSEAWVERVEVFLGAVEIGNGFEELVDAEEQDSRFLNDLRSRQDLGYCEVSRDFRLIEALRSGVPECAGMAIGLDRLLMVLCGAESIGEVLSFDFSRA